MKALTYWLARGWLSLIAGWIVVLLVHAIYRDPIPFLVTCGVIATFCSVQRVWGVWRDK